MNELQLIEELEKAYRCIQGLHNSIVMAKVQSSSVGYHMPTIAAAKRFVYLGALDGSEYFIGKDVSVLQRAMQLSINREPVGDEHDKS